MTLQQRIDSVLVLLRGMKGAARFAHFAEMLIDVKFAIERHDAETRLLRDVLRSYHHARCYVCQRPYSSMLFGKCWPGVCGVINEKRDAGWIVRAKELEQIKAKLSEEDSNRLDKAVDS